MKKIAAFTLIELLVVIAIIALLLSILMPGLRKAKEMAQSIVCRNHLKSLAVANELYASEMDGKYVPFIDDTQVGSDNWCWYTNDYFRKIMGFDSRKTTPAGTGKPDKYVLQEEFWCPSDKQVRNDGYWRGATFENRISYGYNWTDWGPYSKEPYDNWGWTQIPPPVLGHEAGKIKGAGRKVMFIDGGDFRACKYGADYKHVWDITGPDIKRYRELDIWDPVYYRHSNGANMAFFDGHVEYLPKEEVFFYDPRNSDNPDNNANNQMWFVNLANAP